MIIPSFRTLPLLTVLALGAAFGSTRPLPAADLALPGQPKQEPTAKADAVVEPTVASIAARRVELQSEIATTRAELARLPEAASDDTAQWLTREIALLERIDAILVEQSRNWQHADDLAVEAAEIDDRTRNQRPPEATVTPPYTLALLDQLYGERDYLEQATTALKQDLESTELTLREARQLLEEKNRERRAIRDANRGATAPSRLAGNQRLAELETRLAQETVLLREKALRTLKFQQSLIAPKLALLLPRLAWLRANLALGAEPVDETLEDRTRELDEAIATARKEAEAATRIAVATERRAATAKIEDELESRRSNRQTADRVVSVLTVQRGRLAEMAAVTGLRRRVLTGGLAATELRTLARENRAALDLLVQERRLAVTDLVRSRRELQEWQGRLSEAAAADDRVPAWSLDRVKGLTAWIQLSERETAELHRLRLERERLQEEIGLGVNLFSWRDATALTREKFVGAWNFEVFSVQDQPVRVKTILAVLLLVFLGYHGSRWLSALVSDRVFKRLGMATGRRAAWQSLWFYGLMVVVLVTAFNLFHISLTQFSVVSGALAVGIGFGSQNLVSNFISGIILLIERPVNQGDVIEIEGRRVTVERLGARSTIVRTLDNTHMVVPNSHLLERAVINWTLSDEVVRQVIKVGVAYGSPTRKVAELLQTVLSGIETVRKEPKPLVNFADFGESALTFEIFFWATIEERIDTENEIRHRIAEAFAKEGIVMAFPQRDVHLETTKPLQVVITPANPSPGAVPPGPPAQA